VACGTLSVAASPLSSALSPSASPSLAPPPLRLTGSRLVAATREGSVDGGSGDVIDRGASAIGSGASAIVRSASGGSSDVATVAPRQCLNCIVGDRERDRAVLAGSGVSWRPDGEGVASALASYEPCSEGSWRGVVLEWAGPFVALDQCLSACRAYYGTTLDGGDGDREGDGEGDRASAGDDAGIGAAVIATGVAVGDAGAGGSATV
jgi:hypothetical protein